jgi:hypothetical protein
MESDVLDAAKETARPAKSWRVSSGSVKRHIETEQKRRDRINEGCAATHHQQCMLVSNRHMALSLQEILSSICGHRHLCAKAALPHSACVVQVSGPA